jgi:3-deoxy-7-phosphoheptulonate synthase
MYNDKIENVNITAEEILISPTALKNKLPTTDKSEATVISGRKSIKSILEHKDKRLLVVAGPCSIHDLKAAKEYALKLNELRKKYEDTLFIVMRVYFEKPRTTTGWKGFINDPFLDDSFQISKGLEKARELLLWIAELGLPTGTEVLDPISPQYLADLFSWSAVGARTTESQTHRELASGLSMPIGFKNSTIGSLDVAINAMRSAASKHNFLGINRQGNVCVIKTKGNKCGHVILRGGLQPNYSSVDINLCEQALTKANLPHNIVVDCSHGNSNKKFELQPLVTKDIINQIDEGNKSIVGCMLESNLNAGNQAVPNDLSQLKYGVSITDACIDWKTTEYLLQLAYEKLKLVLPKR